MKRSRNSEARIQKPEVTIGEPAIRIRYPDSVTRSATLVAEPAPARRFEDLMVWRKAHQFVLAVYQFTERFPNKELYGLTSQLRRASVSVPANIAEGFKKRGKADQARFLNVAQGSLEECRYYLILSQDLNYGEVSGLQCQLTEVSKLLEAYPGTILNSVF
jgi:four helix bundle protein